jgi:hypothetical protein
MRSRGERPPDTSTWTLRGVGSAEATFDLGEQGVVRLRRFSLRRVAFARGRPDDDLYSVVAQGPMWRATRASGVRSLVTRTIAAQGRGLVMRAISRLARLLILRPATRFLVARGVLPKAMALGVYPTATAMTMRRCRGSELHPKLIVANAHRRTAVVITDQTVSKIYSDVRNRRFEQRLTSIGAVQESLGRRRAVEPALPFGVPPVISTSVGADVAVVVMRFVPGRLLSGEESTDPFGRALSLVPSLRSELRAWAASASGRPHLEALSLRAYLDAQMPVDGRDAIVGLVEERLVRPLLALGGSDLVLAHGDLWSGNIVDGDRLQIIDWDKCAVLPDWYDGFYLGFHETLRLSRHGYRHQHRPIDPSADAATMLASRCGSVVLDRLRTFVAFADRHLENALQIDHLEATYFRLAGAYWACDVGWSGGLDAVGWLAAHADRLDAGRGPGVMNELLERT